MPIDGTKLGTSRQGGSLPTQPKRIMGLPAPTCARGTPTSAQPGVSLVRRPALDGNQSACSRHESL